MVFKDNFDLISLLASIFTSIGSFFLVRSLLKTGAREIAAMSGTYWGSNPHMEEALVEQKTDTVMGFILTLFGGVFSFNESFYGFTVSLNSNALFYVFLVVVLIAFGCNFLSKMMRRKLKRKVSAISFAIHVSKYLNEPEFNALKLINDAKMDNLSVLIGSQDPYEGLSQILRYAGFNTEAEMVLQKKKQP